MIKHLKYLSYVLIHKWFVFVECCRLGIPALGIIHDLSKFRFSEWFPYANYFYGSKKSNISKGGDETGYYKPADSGDINFDLAWLYHQHRNKHHWQYWHLVQDEDSDKTMKMPLKYAKEMLADWRGAGKAQGFADSDACLKWYMKNRLKMKLHSETRIWIENQLGFLQDE